MLNLGENTNKIITYKKKGGIADIEDTLTIYSDGRVAFSSSVSGKKVFEKKTKISLDVVQKLVSLFRQTNFPSFENKYMSEALTFDGITHALTFSDRKKTKTVKTETEGHPPQGYKLIENELEALILKLKK